MKTLKIRWERVWQNIKKFKLETLPSPPSYSEFWKWKYWRINSHHCKSIIKFRKNKSFLSGKTKGSLRLIFHVPIICLFKTNFQQYHIESTYFVFLKWFFLLWKYINKKPFIPPSKQKYPLLFLPLIINLIIPYFHILSPNPNTFFN